MEYTFLGKSNLKVSRLGFGCCPMGGHGWGEVDDREMISSVHSALELGVNLFDTADVYGLGHSEEVLGTALQGIREKAVIATKFGVRRKDSITYYDNSTQWMEQALDASLGRLNTDYIDLYQVHYRDGSTPIDEVIKFLEKQRDKGKIRYYGLSNVSLQDIDGINKNHIPGLVTFQNEFSLANRTKEQDIRDLVKSCMLSVMTWGSLGQGILSGKYNMQSAFDNGDRRNRAEYQNFHGERLKRNLLIVEKMKEISKEKKKPLTAIAVRWILDYLKNAVVLTGIKNREQLLQNAAALGWCLEQNEVNVLEIISRDTLS